MNSPPASPEYSIYYLQQKAETRTESRTTIQSSPVIYLHQQQTEARTISTTTPKSTSSTLDHQNSDDSTRTTTTLDSNELIPRPSTATTTNTLDSNELIHLTPTTNTTATLDSNELIPIPPTTSFSSFSPSSPSSSLETLADAVPPLSPPTSSPPSPLLTPNNPSTRHLNPTDIRPHLETIDRTALPPAYRPAGLGRIEAAEILLEIRHGRLERSREGTVELELELGIQMERSRLPSSRSMVVQVNDGICGEGAAKEGGGRGGAVWGSRLRANTKKSLKLTT